MTRSFAVTCMAAAAAAFVSLALPAPSQARSVEAELNSLHHRCERGDQHACVEFGRLLENNRNRHQDWRRSHPEYWSSGPNGGPNGGPPPGPPPGRVVEPVTPQLLKRLHRECERGNRAACADYRHVLESNPQHHDEWRRLYPEFWIWLRN